MDRPIDFINSGAATAWLQAGGNSTAHQQSTRNGWENPQLTLVGLYYPLGPCKKILERSQLDRILQNLREIFQKFSLETTSQDEPIMATCRSLDQVEFTVTILQSRNDSSKIVLEIMRHSGDTMAYHRYARQVMAAVAATSATTSTMQPGWCVRKLKLVATMDPVYGKEQEQQGAVNGALELVWNMLSTDRYDAQRRGLESLIHITDPNKSGWSTSKTATESLLKPNGNPTQNRIFDCLFKLACQSNLEFSPRAHADWSFLALTILSQMLRVAAAQSHTNLGYKQPTQFWKKHQGVTFVDCMLQKVYAAQGHPHEAYYATQCLTALCLTAPEFVISRISICAVQEAEQFGLSHHLALANASRELLVAVHA